MITIRDVAREAGVSVATVSRALNDSASVSAATRERVHAVAARLRYAPNGAARSLITRRTGTIGVLLPDLYGEFFSEVIRGIDQTAQRHGYHLLVSSSHAEPATLTAALQAMHGRVDGLLVMAPELDTLAAAAPVLRRCPVVLLNGSTVDRADGETASPPDGRATRRAGARGGGPGEPPVDASFDRLTVENFEGARAMTRHLLALGHRRIALIAGAERNQDAAERQRGYLAALAEAGRRVDRRLILRGDFSEAAGFRAGKILAGQRPRPSAVFAANDAMAIGALSALREAGLRVPDDIALVGFDDIPLARYMSPPLSTVHVDIGLLGARGASMLIDALTTQGPRRSRHLVLPTSLVVRGSCGCRDRPPPPPGRA